LKGAQHAKRLGSAGGADALRPPFGPVGDEWPDSFEHALHTRRFDVARRWISMWRTPRRRPVLADTLREHDPPHPRRALVGVLGDKDYSG